MDNEKQKIYLDKQKFIEGILKDRNKILNENISKLPNEELPFMEPHLRTLYFETYFLLAEGFYNSSLVLGGIFLENLTKEKLFMEKIKDDELESMNFAQTIKKCKEMDVLKEDELNFLENKKERLRNPYAHYNKMKLSKGVYFRGWKIDNPVEKLIALGEQVKKGELTEVQARKKLIEGVEPELISSEEFRPIAHIAKNMLEEQGLAMSTFLEIDKFTREFAEKYFKPEK